MASMTRIETYAAAFKRCLDEGMEWVVRDRYGIKSDSLWEAVVECYDESVKA